MLLYTALDTTIQFARFANGIAGIFTVLKVNIFFPDFAERVVKMARSFCLFKSNFRKIIHDKKIFSLSRD